MVWTKVSKFIEKGLSKIPSWLIILLITFPVFIPLLRTEFFLTHDIVYVARLYEMEKSLQGGQFPVRWSPDLRYGEPSFNFYAPLPYYLGAIVRLTSLGYIDTAKVIIILSFVLSAFSMYLLSKEIFGKWPAILSVVLYLYAPYRSVDVYVRGAFSEAFVFIFLPLTLYFSLRLFKSGKQINIGLLALSLAGIFLTHNITTLIFVPFLAPWIVVLFLIYKSWRSLIMNIISFVLAFGLTSSFLIPAFLEKKFVQTDFLTTGYFNYVAHFVGFKQFFSTFWGYGSSVWGPDDGFSFQIGFIHWIIVALAVGTFLYKFKSLTVGKRMIFIFFFGSFIFTLFMQHNRSTFIWKVFPILSYVQFPWRFLTISVVFVSLIGGYISELFGKNKLVILIVFMLGTMIVNVGYFKPEKYQKLSDDYFVSEEIMTDPDKFPKDYLPIWVKEIRRDRIKLPYSDSGEVSISNYSKNNHSATFDLDVIKEAEIEVPISYFPGWKVFLNNREISLDSPSNYGFIKFLVPPGKYNVVTKFFNTPVRTFSNTISLVSFGILFYLFIKYKNNFKNV